VVKFDHWSSFKLVKLQTGQIWPLVKWPLVKSAWFRYFAIFTKWSNSRLVKFDQWSNLTTGQIWTWSNFKLVKFDHWSNSQVVKSAQFRDLAIFSLSGQIWPLVKILLTANCLELNSLPIRDIIRAEIRSSWPPPGGGDPAFSPISADFWNFPSHFLVVKSETGQIWPVVEFDHWSNSKLVKFQTGQIWPLVKWPLVKSAWFRYLAIFTKWSNLILVKFDQWSNLTTGQILNWSNSKLVKFDHWSNSEVVKSA
jgi:hypothetical protein